MNALSIADPVKSRAVVSKLVALLEIEYATLIVESNLFLDGADHLTSGRLSIVALDATRRRVEQLPIDSARRLCQTRDSLAVFCYAWALGRIARGRTVEAIDWGDWSAKPIDLSDFQVVALVSEGRRELR